MELAEFICKVKLAWLIPDWEQEIRGCLVEETRHSLYRVRANTQISWMSERTSRNPSVVCSAINTILWPCDILIVSTNSVVVRTNHVLSVEYRSCWTRWKVHLDCCDKKGNYFEKSLQDEVNNRSTPTSVWGNLKHVLRKCAWVNKPLLPMFGYR